MRRDGTRLILPVDQLVVGDIVLLEPGDHVPADMRLFEAKNLQIQEAVLTGESLPVEKTIAARRKKVRRWGTALSWLIPARR